MRDDVHDDSVWTNGAYPLSALFSPTAAAFGLMMLLGINLGAWSGVYHSTYERWSQRLDVWSMMTYVSGATIVLWVETIPWAGVEMYFLIVPVSLVYAIYTWDINSYVHVPVWAAVALLFVALETGWWVALPTLFLLVGAGIKLADPGADTEWHSFWHVSSAGAVGSAFWLVGTPILFSFLCSVL